jgi:hypothetical protein
VYRLSLFQHLSLLVDTSILITKPGIYNLGNH